MTEPVDTSKWTEADWDRAMYEASLELNAQKNLKSGMIDDPDYNHAIGQPQATCRHPHHQPPTGLVIPPGKLYQHVCTGCKNVVILKSNVAYC